MYNIKGSNDPEDQIITLVRFLQIGKKDIVHTHEFC
jgi:hypothetical protein